MKTFLLEGSKIVADFVLALTHFSFVGPLWVYFGVPRAILIASTFQFCLKSRCLHD